MISSDAQVPSFSADVVNSLPLYYRALAEHLAETGRAVIEDTSEKERT
jgi:uncharacterized membrane-anchored protein YhcB (DUF1043 family)